MYRLKIELRSPSFATGLLLTLVALSACSGPAPEQTAEGPETVTVYEGRAAHRG